MIEEKILNQFKDLLGEKNLITQADILHLAEQTNYKTDEKVVAIIYPEDINILKSCLLLASKHSILLYPISKGKNWGYGSKVPLHTNSIIIDLSKFNKIIDYNETLGYVTIEPGVTFQQLFDFLREKNSELIISATGSSKDSSLIGNALDRGIGTGLYADRFSTVCDLEIMLVNGDIIKTGFGHFGDSTTAKVYKWGIGPSLDGLFSQSNFGIVTKMTMWLIPVPEYLSLIFYKIKNTEKLPQVIDILRKLSLNGLIRPTFTIYNDVRVVSTIKQYPFDKFDPKIDSVESVMKLLKDSIGISNVISAWNGEISIRSMNLEHSRIQCNIIKEAINDEVESIDLVEVSKKEILETLQAHYQGTHKNSNNDLKNFLLGKYIGIPNEIAIRQTYWRKKQVIPIDMNPDRDKCGMIWICPVVPFTKEDIELAVKIIVDTIKKYSFEPSISLQCMSERAINIIASIAWDRDLIEDDQKAIECYTNINKTLNDNGFYAYRNTTFGMKTEKQNSDSTNTYNNLLKKIKTVFDPENIIAPGRYIN